MYMYIDKKKIINDVNLFTEQSLVGTSRRASWSLSYRTEWPWSLRGAIPPGDSASCWVNSCLSPHRYHINPNTLSHCYLISDNHCIASSMELHCLVTGKTLAQSNQLNVVHLLYCVITDKTKCLNWYRVTLISCRYCLHTNITLCLCLLWDITSVRLHLLHWSEHMHYIVSLLFLFTFISLSDHWYYIVSSQLKHCITLLH